PLLVVVQVIEAWIGTLVSETLNWITCAIGAVAPVASTDPLSTSFTVDATDAGTTTSDATTANRIRRTARRIREASQGKSLVPLPASVRAVCPKGKGTRFNARKGGVPRHVAVKSRRA